MYVLRDSSQIYCPQNASHTRGASCQAKGESHRPAAPQHLAPRRRDLLLQSSCSWCGCFQWQCGHRHRNQRPQRGAWAVAAAGPAGDAAGSGRLLASSSAAPSALSCGPPPAPIPAAELHDEAPEWSPPPPQLPQQQQPEVLAPPPPRQPLSQQQQQQHGQQGAGSVGWKAPEQPERWRQPSGGGGGGRSDRGAQAPPPEAHPRAGLVSGGEIGPNLPPPLPPRRAWDPGPGAPAQSRGYDAGPGPPPQESCPASIQPFLPHQPPPLEPSTLVPAEPGAADRGAPVAGGSVHGVQALVSTTADGPKGGSFGAVGSAGAGAAFRAALRACRCLDDLEALLDGHAPPPPLVPPPLQQLQQQQQQPVLPAVESLSVPSLTAVVSSLPRMPEAFSASGRRRLRQLLAARLTPPVLLAARRGELDAAGVAIIAAALAQLGSEVTTDPRVGRSDLVDELAAVGLAACRLPLEPGGWRQGRERPPSPPLPLPPQQAVRRYGHSSRSYSTLLYALAKMGYRPDDVWLERYLAASRNWLRAFPPRDLAAAAWALAAMRYRPGEAWLGALLEAWLDAGHQPGGFGAAVDVRHSGGHSHGNDDPWVAASGAPPGAAVEAAASGRRADAHSLSLLLWALWRLDVAAPPAWLDGALSQCAFPTAITSTTPSAAAAAAANPNPFLPPVRSKGGGTTAPFPAATCQSLALVSYCTARMGHTPPARVRQALLAAAGPLLQRGSAQDLVLLLVGVAHWPKGAAAATAAAAAHGDSNSSSGVAAAAVVPERWLQQLCTALRQRLVGCSAQALVLSLSALSHLSYSPGPAWLDEHEAALRPLLAAGRLDGRAAARVAAAWARLRHRPGRNVVDRLLKMLVAAAAAGDMYGSGNGGSAAAAAPAQQRRRWLSARLFAQGLYGVAVLVAARRAATPHPTAPAAGLSKPSPPPPPPSPLLAAIHLRALLAASQSRLPYSYLDEALLHLRAWRLLRLAPPHQWLANLAAVARGAKLCAAPPAVLLELLRLLAWPGWRRMREPTGSQPPPQQPPHPQVAVAALTEHHIREEPGGRGGGGGGGLPVSAALVGAVAERLAAAMPELTVRQLADLAGALAALRVRPTRSWLRALLAVVEVRIRSGDGLDLDLEPDVDLDLDLETAKADLDPDVQLIGSWRGLGMGEEREGLPAPPRGPAARLPAGLRALHAAAALAAALDDPELQYMTAQLLETYGTAVAAAAAAAALPLPQSQTQDGTPADAGVSGSGLTAEAGAGAGIVAVGARQDVRGGLGQSRQDSGVVKVSEPAVAGASAAARGT
ncbi:hypothetical protein PLESTM_000169200 [Pleodorina starrii]|nr:hypothetical protein PLESTM_000169200 [Pleodorina starrii]